MFQKGQSGNPAGRPKRKIEEDYLKALASSVTPEDWQMICQRAVRDAKKGDATARKWLSDYLIGAPVQKLEHTGEDGGAIRIEYVNTPYPITDVSPSTGGDTPETQEV
jgi:hypothetical protein